MFCQNSSSTSILSWAQYILGLPLLVDFALLLVRFSSLDFFCFVLFYELHGNYVIYLVLHLFRPQSTSTRFNLNGSTGHILGTLLCSITCLSQINNQPTAWRQLHAFRHVRCGLGDLLRFKVTLELGEDGSWCQTVLQVWVFLIYWDFLYWQNHLWGLQRKVPQRWSCKMGGKPKH